ncbi:hypothetical protein D3C73_880810 [compost metagenome]
MPLRTEGLDPLPRGRIHTIGGHQHPPHRHTARAVQRQCRAIGLQVLQLRTEEVITQLGAVDVAQQQMQPLLPRRTRRLQRASAIPDPVHQPRRMRLQSRTIARGGIADLGIGGTQWLTT